jgi:PhnB protein
MAIHPYLYFSGRAEEAIAFYQKAIGAELTMLLRFKDSPEPAPEGVIAPGWENKVMHANLKIDGADVHLSDGCGADNAGFKGFSLTYTAKDDAEADRVFAALAEGGHTRMPLGKTFFAQRFGMVEDRFGVLWNVIVPA